MYQLSIYYMQMLLSLTNILLDKFDKTQLQLHCKFQLNNLNKKLKSHERMSQLNIVGNLS